MTHRRFTALVAALALACCGLAQAGPFTFVNIADSAGEFSNFGRGVSLNDAGLVSFQATFDAGGATGIFTGSGGAVATVASAGGQFSGFGVGTALSNAGTVAFQATLTGGGSGIFTMSGGSSVTIAQTGDEFTGFGPYVAINETGKVAFLGTLTAGGAGVFAGNGVALTPIADTSGQFSGFGSIGGPLESPGVSINEAGTTAFFATLDAGGGGIFTSADGLAVTTIADSASDGLSGVARHPSINDAGTVALAVSYAAGGGAVLTGDGGPLTTVADTNGQFLGFPQAAINNGGEVAFLGARDAGGGGYFTSDDLLDGLLELGDPLFGSFVTGLETVFSFNDAGQLAFWYDLADGRRGIARADPVPQSGAVPAPGSLLLLALGFAALLASRRLP